MSRARCSGSNAMPARRDAWHLKCSHCGRSFIEGHQLAGQLVPTHYTAIQAEPTSATLPARAAVLTTGSKTVNTSLPTAPFRAIRTRFVGPTNSRGSRVIADAGDRQSTVTVSWDHALNSEQNHAAAALAVVNKMGWNTEYHTPITGGQHGNAYYWVFTPKAQA